MKKFYLALTMLACVTTSFAQIPGLHRDQKPATPEKKAALAQMRSRSAAAKMASITPADSTCAFGFSTGSNYTFLSYCVSDTGNVLTLVTPEDHPEISADQFEGYAICDENSGVAYSDFGGGGDSGNWAPATVLSHNATAVKVARTTSDGIWTLTQTITNVAGNSPSVKIAMTLKNNTAVDREALLMRYADIDADGFTPNELDATTNTAMAYNSIEATDTGEPFGLALQNVGTSNFLYEGFVQNNFHPPDPCNAGANLAPQSANTDGSIVQIYLLELAKSRSGTVTVAYKGL